MQTLEDEVIDFDGIASKSSQRPGMKFLIPTGIKLQTFPEIFAEKV